MGSALERGHCGGRRRLVFDDTGSVLECGHGGERRGHTPDGRADGEALERVLGPSVDLLAWILKVMFNPMVEFIYEPLWWALRQMTIANHDRGA